jgi:benzoyl-CoA 2,3-epoxidase subunit B
MDLFGSEQSTNAAAYYTGGLKGRWQEARRKDDHVLADASYTVRSVRDDTIVEDEVPYLTALNLDLRDEYVADCRNGVRRWNQALEDAGVEQRLYLPHEGFNRRVGNFSGHFVSPDGDVLSEDDWNRNAAQWLPSDEDRARVAELMVAHYEPGDFAGWIAPPKTGINDQPVEFDYVHLREEALA